MAIPFDRTVNLTDVGPSPMTDVSPENLLMAAAIHRDNLDRFAKPPEAKRGRPKPNKPINPMR